MKQGGVENQQNIKNVEKVDLFYWVFSKPNFDETKVKTTSSHSKFCPDFKNGQHLVVGPTAVPEI